NAHSSNSTSERFIIAHLVLRTVDWRIHHRALPARCDLAWQFLSTMTVGRLNANAQSLPVVGAASAAGGKSAPAEEKCSRAIAAVLKQAAMPRSRDGERG